MQTSSEVTDSGHIQSYDLGSKDEISRLFGITESRDKPAAEIWMGAHVTAPSKAIINNQRLPLDQLIADHPQHLGTLLSLAQYGIVSG